MNFKDHFFNNKNSISSANTGSHHHQSNARVTKMGERKKGLHLIAKSQSQPKKTLHPKIDLCLKLKKDTPLYGNEPFDIMKKFNLCPTPNEPSKAIKKMPVSLKLIKPNVYILKYEGENM